jgi:hypothetical protein
MCGWAVAGLADAIDLQQGWSPDVQDRWFASSQGSRLIPLSWFMALERPESTERFASDGNTERYGYFPYDLRYGDRATFRVPRGFVIDRQDDRNLSFTKLRWKEGQRADEEWIGMTCSACHTAQIRYGGESITVLGGPTGADFQGFFHEFREALTATAIQPEKFARFAATVLGDQNNPANRVKLIDALEALRVFYVKAALLNQTSVVYGPGRVDAVGHILNKVAQINGAVSPRSNPSTAPVSYPFLWNVPQHDRVQWNGMAENKRTVGVGGGGLDYGALGRNMGEVIGVFADIQPQSSPGPLSGYVSSVNVDNLVGLEQSLETLLPPRWPEEFGAIDTALVNQGRQLFQTRGCVKCHALLSRTDITTPIVASMARIARNERLESDGKPATIATDPSMACNTYQFKSHGGLMVGTRRVADTRVIISDDYLSEMLGVAAERVLLGKKPELAAQGLKGLFGIRTLPEPAEPPRGVWRSVKRGVLSLLGAAEHRDPLIEQCYALSSEVKMLAYKARPLTGIWATSPYLHNGSVPTLFDLLLPPDRRPKTFYAGTEQFDPVRVGFVTTHQADNPFLFDVTAPGNSNGGHDYGASRLSDAERTALTEYMKTL